MNTNTQDILKEREKTYGQFERHAKISQDIKHVMRNAPGWAAMASDQQEALEMIAHKIARILNGNPVYIDSWVDICGYAQLVVNRLFREAHDELCDA
jgi:hypothetical protein